MTTIQQINIRAVLDALHPGTAYGWNPVSGTKTNPDIGHNMNVVTWRDIGDKPTEAAVIAEWESHPEIYEIVEVSVEHRAGDTYRITVTKIHNIDGLTILTLTADGVTIPGVITLVANMGMKDIDVETSVSIGVVEDYPHELIRIEV